MYAPIVSEDLRTLMASGNWAFRSASELAVQSSRLDSTITLQAQWGVTQCVNCCNVFKISAREASTDAKDFAPLPALDVEGGVIVIGTYFVSRV